MSPPPTRPVAAGATVGSGGGNGSPPPPPDGGAGWSFATRQLPPAKVVADPYAALSTPIYQVSEKKKN